MKLPFLLQILATSSEGPNLLSWKKKTTTKVLDPAPALLGMWVNKRRRPHTADSPSGSAAAAPLRVSFSTVGFSAPAPLPSAASAGPRPLGSSFGSSLTSG